MDNLTHPILTINSYYSASTQIWSGNLQILSQPPDYSLQKLIYENVFVIETEWKPYIQRVLSFHSNRIGRPNNIPSVHCWYYDKFSSCFSIINKCGVDTTWVFETSSNKIPDFSNSWKWLSVFNASSHCSKSDKICADSPANSIKQMLIYADDLHSLQVTHLALRKNDGYSLEALLSVRVFMAGKEYLCCHRK